MQQPSLDLDLGQVLLLVALVLLVAVFAVRLSGKFGLPSLLVYLGLGLFLGESGPLHIQFNDAQLARDLAFVALILILTEGGLTTRWSSVRNSMPLGLSLATVGVAVSACVVAMFAHFVLGQSWQTSFLIGAITAPTDAAAVFSVLRRVPLPQRLGGALEAESGLNDAPTVLLVVLLSSSGGHSLLGFLGTVAWELGAGTVLGIAVGFAGTVVIRRIGPPGIGLSALAVFAIAVLTFGIASAAHASGFAAVYVAALVLGNSGLPYRRTTRSFAEGLAGLSQIGLFVMLGMLVWPSRLAPKDLLFGVLIGLVLLLVARPLAVLIAASPFRLPLREQGFLSWAGLRGAVPIVLATIPLAATDRPPQAQLVFDLVFFLVLALTGLQAPLLPYVAKKLRVGLADQVGELDVEVAPLQVLDADLVELTIRPGSRLAGVEVGELRLPRGASVSLIVRRGEAIVPGKDLVLRLGDDVLVVADRRVRAETEERLRAVSKDGRLARWLGA